MAIDNKMMLVSIIKQIDTAIEMFNTNKFNESSQGFADPITSRMYEVYTTMLSTIERLTPSNSVYRQNMEHLIEGHVKRQGHYLRAMYGFVGILRTLRNDYESGYIQPLRELIHADVFADFLDMAYHLLGEGYKDPAAVMVGSVLEEHIRKLCLKYNILLEIQKPDGTLQPKKADVLNAELTSQNIYNKLEQKTITAWLDLRNKAAHGKYSEYTKEQVDLMLLGVRDFIHRYPA